MPAAAPSGRHAASRSAIATDRHPFSFFAASGSMVLTTLSTSEASAKSSNCSSIRRFDVGQVEDIVDESEEMSGRAKHAIERFKNARIQNDLGRGGKWQARRISVNKAWDEIVRGFMIECAAWLGVVHGRVPSDARQDSRCLTSVRWKQRKHILPPSRAANLCSAV